MGLGRDATTYGFCKENREDMVECGGEVTCSLLTVDNLSGGLSKIILFTTATGVQQEGATEKLLAAFVVRAEH
jgi:hypothetical protein